MGNDVNVPEEAIEAAKKQWRFVAELPQYEPSATARGVNDEYRERIAQENNRIVAQVLEAAAPAIRSQERERERVREAVYQELTHRTGLPDHELIAALDRAESALDQEDADA